MHVHHDEAALTSCIRPVSQAVFSECEEDQPRKTLIEIEGVHHVYGSGKAASSALRGVDIKIPEGAFMAIAGPSGSGKTTLLNLIGALDLPTSGSIRINGCDLKKFGEAETAGFRLREIGFVFQDFNLVPVLSVAENIEFPLLFRDELSTADRRYRITLMMERLELSDKRDRRPGQLSGGERQRVALARALAGAPNIVLADEPTAHLDRDTGAAVIELMRSWNRKHGVTFLYSTHDARLVAMADRVIRLRGGRVEEDR